MILVGHSRKFVICKKKHLTKFATISSKFLDNLLKEIETNGDISPNGHQDEIMPSADQQ